MADVVTNNPYFICLDAVGQLPHDLFLSQIPSAVVYHCDYYATRNDDQIDLVDLDPRRLHTIGYRQGGQ